MTEIEIPDPQMTTRTRLTEVKDPEAWVSPYTPEQALAIALFNAQVCGTLDDALRMSQNASNYLKQMGFTVEFTGV